jgi:hypothetical protein
MVIISNGTPLQPLIAMLIQMVFLLVVLKTAPYKNDLDDWSSFVCSLALTLTILAGFLLMTSKNTDNLPVLSIDLLTTLLITFNAACLIYEVTVIIYVGYQENYAERNKNRNSGGGGETKVTPVLSGKEMQNDRVNTAKKAWQIETKTETKVTPVLSGKEMQNDRVNKAKKAWQTETKTETKVTPVLSGKEMQNDRVNTAKKAWQTEIETETKVTPVLSGKEMQNDGRS